MRIKLMKNILPLCFTIIICFAWFSSCDNKDNPTVHEIASIDHTSQYSASIIVENTKPLELILIGMAISPIQTINLNTGSQYYSEANNYFSAHTGHPFVESLIDALSGYAQPGSDNSEGKGQVFQNLITYSFFRNDSLVLETEAYNSLTDSLKEFADNLTAQANDFMSVSQFNSFYNSHQSIYDDLITQFKKGVPCLTMWNWLESQFNSRYTKYQVLLSPLIGGTHFTFSLEYNKTGWISMFVLGPDTDIFKKTDEGYYSRILFTEIDHNYVNPVSDTYSADINSVFADLNKWGNTIYYPTPGLTFNEYMTWSVFTLYAYDNYSTDDFNTINQNVITTMQGRGFTLFESFNEALLDLYKERDSGKKVEDLFPAILNWAKENN